MPSKKEKKRARKQAKKKEQAAPPHDEASVLMALALKIKDNPRPHFTGDERRAVEAQLGINIYSEKQFCCGHCGKSGRDVKLKRCSRCDTTWFCDRECQQAAYENNSHKKCKKKTFFVIADEFRQEVESHVEAHGAFPLKRNDGGDNLVVVLRDSSSGRLFDSLSDMDVYFFPSEINQLPEEYHLDNLLCSKKDQKRLRDAAKASPSMALSTSNAAADARIGQSRIVQFKDNILAKYGNRWSSMLHDLLQNDDVMEVEGKVADFFSDIALLHEQEWKEFTGLDTVSLDLLSVFPLHKTAYLLRGGARFDIGVDLDGAIQDLTAAENFLHHEPTSYGDLSGLGVHGEPSSDGALDGLDLSLIQIERRCAVLKIRGICYRRKGDIDTAILDFGAVRALRHLLRKSYLESPDDPDFTEEYLIALALKKKGHLRPHYSGVERNKLERDLGINIYHQTSRHCGTCGKTRVADDVTLRLCSRCESAWFCDKTCLDAAKDNGHNPEGDCKKDKVIFLTDDVKASIEDSIDAIGCAPLYNVSEPTHFDVLFRDESTRRLFDSLYDCDVYFLPSEQGLVPEEFQSIAQELALVDDLGRMSV